MRVPAIKDFTRTLILRQSHWTKEKNDTCNFYAVAKGSQMQIHKHYVDDKKACDIVTYPDATISGYCALKGIRREDIDNPRKDWKKDVRYEKILWLGKHSGIEAVSGQWASPRRIELENVSFLGMQIRYGLLAKLLRNGNPIMCQIIVGPGFEKLKANEVWSCEPRFTKTGELEDPFYYHVVVLVDCGKRGEALTFLNSGGRQFGYLGYGLIMLKDIKWPARFILKYPLKFLPAHGRCSFPKISSSTTMDAPRWRQDNIAAKQTSQHDPKASSELAWGLQEEKKNNLTPKAQRWCEGTPYRSVPWCSPSTAQDHSLLNAPSWRRDNVAVSRGKMTMKQESEGSRPTTSWLPDVASPTMAVKFLPAHGRCSIPKISSSTTINAPRWRQDNIAAKQTSQHDPGASSELAWGLQEEKKNNLTPKAQRWCEGTPYRSVPWCSPSTAQDHSLLNAPSWRRDNVAVSGGKMAMKQESEGSRPTTSWLPDVASPTMVRTL
jgi:hypothetical protein